ncbi:hypothetical protein EDB83DRAFT_2410360 [Lactarius deliciosus]|nr:hypothetical protein EDB83DRAFT_2410360 [Lactarius deliciosus]
MRLGMRTIGMTGTWAGMGAWTRRAAEWAVQRTWAALLLLLLLLRWAACVSECGRMGTVGSAGRTKLLTICIATSSESLLELIVTTHMILHV